MFTAIGAARHEGNTSSSDEHLPWRPRWGCRQCGQAWPCDPAKDVLLAEARRSSRTAVLVYLGICLHDAAPDLVRGTATPDLYERFVAWAR